MDTAATIEMSVTAFAPHEILYILETVGSTNANYSRDRLEIALEADEPNLRAGLTSLFVRGQVAVSSEVVELSNVAAAVGFVLTSQARWFEITNVAEGFNDGAWLVRFEALALLIRPQPLATFEVRLLDPKQAAEWLARTTYDYLREGADRAVFMTERIQTTSKGLAAKCASGQLVVEDETGRVVLDGGINDSKGALESAVNDFLGK